MNIFSQLKKAILENLAGNPTTTVLGRIYFNTTDKVVKWLSAAGTWKTAVDTDSAQVITGKDIDGGTASDTSRITVPKNATATLSGLTRKEGTVVFDSTLKTFKGDNGSTLDTFATTAIATQTAHGIVTAYAPTVQSRVKDIANADYAILDSDGFDIVCSITTLSAGRTVTLPTAADNTGRKITIAKYDTGAYNLTVKGEAAGETINGISGTTGINLYPQYISVTLFCTGSIWLISESKLTSGWISYTPGAVSGLGTPSAYDCWYRRVGDSCEVNCKITCGTVTSAAFQIRIPTGLDIRTDSTTKLVIGSIATNYSGADIRSIRPVINSSYPNDIQAGINNSASILTPVAANGFIGNSGIVYMTAIVPIVAWAIQ